MHMLTMEDIVRDGHPTLREKAKKVDVPPSSKTVETLQKMHEFLVNSQDEDTAKKYNLRPGVGLAAPQLGISEQLIAIYFHYDDVLYNYQLINPKIISHSVERACLAGGEGCLSVDESIEGYVPRYKRITVRAFDENGKQIKLRLKGYPAIVFQHEIDHLNGIMFYDYINKANPLALPDDVTI